MNTIQNANVSMIIDSYMAALLENENRTFS